MDKNEKVIEMKEAENNAQETTVIETKPKFKDRAKSWAKRNKKKILIVAGAALAVYGAAAAKAYKDKKDEAAAQSEAEQAQLAEDWYQKGLLEAHESSSTDTAVDTEYTPVDEV